MSSAQKLTKKQKKALAFRERKGKSKGKAQAADDVEDNDVPVLEDQDALEAEAEAGPVEDAPQPAKHAGAARAADASVLGDGQPKQTKKRKREEEEDEAAVGDGQPKQKQKKKKRRSNGEDGAAVTEGGDAEEPVGEGKEKAKQRLILFVGNLKYATPKEMIEKHFSACDPPPTVRLLTPKAAPNGRQLNKSKGCAFLEFTAKSALQQALKLHQSELDGRMINVELTAGGGGKSEGRIEKLKKRNKELHEQRRKRLEKQTKKPKDDGAATEGTQVPRPQRYSATSGVEQAPLKKRTWSVAELADAEGKKTKKRGKRPQRSQGTGVNAIPVG
ncbi:hypothetical protein FOMPIDRAFT_87560 [Fomitopsis schrenkii]|uniref:RRM domain-containing protein n=1 Tax=Fomitopsis schrenkii TaxID=2126942 RepID=S8EIF8_FOMSC|nr:hypothetical protein FOMPIDRAFT_87560 [Fomitopsis schrenkii]